MKKGLLALAVLVAITTIAPVAMADHCYRCYNFSTCGPAQQYGRPICDASSGSCVFQGALCTGPHPFAPETEEPLAADFVVASVERRDAPQAAPSGETRVASLETAPQITPQR